MPVIDPFDFAPLGPFPYLTAYAIGTKLKSMYLTDDDPAKDALIAAVFGATTQIFPHQEELGYIYPRTDVLTLGDGRKAVFVRGTTVIPQELAHQVVLSNLVHVEPWMGRVSQYNAIVANRNFNRLPAFPSDWCTFGHSLGGAIAALMTIRGAVKCMTFGQPREGDLTYANSRPSPSKLRITNVGDPVPTVPRGDDSFLGDTDIDVGNPIFVFSEFYRHWGIRRTLFADGTIVLPPFDENNVEPTEELRPSIVAFLEEGALNHHLMDEYCRRIRISIPVAFPAVAPVHPDFPQLAELDSLNAALNAEHGFAQWQIDGTARKIFPFTLSPPLKPFPPPGDTYQWRCQ